MKKMPKERATDSNIRVRRLPDPELTSSICRFQKVKLSTGSVGQRGHALIEPAELEMIAAGQDGQEEGAKHHEQEKGLGLVVPGQLQLLSLLPPLVEQEDDEEDADRDGKGGLGVFVKELMQIAQPPFDIIHGAAGDLGVIGIGKGVSEIMKTPADDEYQGGDIGQKREGMSGAGQFFIRSP